MLTLQSRWSGSWDEVLKIFVNTGYFLSSTLVIFPKYTCPGRLLVRLQLLKWQAPPFRVISHRIHLYLNPEAKPHRSYCIGLAQVPQVTRQG